MPIVDIDGRQVFYTQTSGPKEGTSTAIVFLHGAGGSQQHWANQMAGIHILGVGVQGFAVDLPGHGLTGGRPLGTITAQGEFISRFLERLSLGPCYLAGHSMGGAITLDVALRTPQQVRGLLLVGSGARLRVAPAVLESLRAGIIPHDLAKWLYAPTADPRLVEQAAAELEQVGAVILEASFSACDGFDVMNQLERIEAPVLVVCGQEDQMTPAKYSRFLSERLPRATLVEIPRAGHMTMVEAPEALNQAIKDFLLNNERNS